ncbi:MAG TPA: hypothetical protein PLK31_19590 [Chloroflexota bacterium]|nr:hypothetical protein [Chloroflexota bacterium]
MAVCEQWVITCCRGTAVILQSPRPDIAEFADKVALHAMNRRIPASLEGSYQTSLSFEAVLAGTEVNGVKTAVTQLAAPGVHPIWLHTPSGEIACRVKVHLPSWAG